MMYVGILSISVKMCTQVLHDPHHRTPSFAMQNIKSNNSGADGAQEQEYRTEYCEAKGRSVLHPCSGKID